MNGAILDTHALLWLIEDDPRLGTRAKETIETGTLSLFVSYASLWEIAVKLSIGKLSLSLPIEEFTRQRVLSVGISLLEIKLSHIAKYAELALHHRDPFDRLLAAQCLSEAMPIFSHDQELDAYGLDRIWD